MTRTRVKICGLTRVEDAKAVVAAGADALGLVFYPPSPRAISVSQAAGIVEKLPPLVTVVGLFVNAERTEIARILSAVRIDLLQFHGDETMAECSGHGRPYINAVRVRPGTDLNALRGRYAGAAGLLLDTYREDRPGGTGERFDWACIPEDMAGNIILAGGLTPENVEQAVRQVRPYAVDVSGGVEQEKGVKERAKIEAFMRGVRRADQ